MPKLVAIGDSLTQGVMSGAISKTELSYPALIAEAMNLKIWKSDVNEAPNCNSEFLIPHYLGDGLPLNFEKSLKYMENEFGSNLDDDNFVNVLLKFQKYVDCVEKFYEVGEGTKPSCHNVVYHNLAIAGFRVYDSFNVDSNYCQKQIKEQEGKIRDDAGPPSASMYRIAERVLNPAQCCDRANWTQIDNLAHFKNNEDPVENLLLFMGANDCLGTVVKLDIVDMEDEKKEVSRDPEKRREEYNLTSTEVFKDDYREMVRRISDAISPCTKVFVGTIPHVTIAPITRGISEDKDYPENRKYFPFYGPPFADPHKRGRFEKYLSRDKVIKIDKRIDKFNSIIRKAIKEVPENGKWYIVDICKTLDDLAVKRNYVTSGEADDEKKRAQSVLEKFFKDRKISNHKLLSLCKTPSVLRFETAKEKWSSGGLFSLDCIHPTTIGYGIIAEEFLRVMKEKTSCNDESKQDEWNIDWNCVVKRDTLINCPPKLWDDIIKRADNYSRFLNIAFYRIFAAIHRLFK